MKAPVIRGFFDRIGPREIAYCEKCGHMEPWWRAERAKHGQAGCVMCGSSQVSRGELPAAGGER